MDKALFRAYIRELVKEMVEDEVGKVLPKLLGEAVAEIKTLQENKVVPVPAKQKLDRTKLAQLMGLDRMDEDTLVASTKNMITNLPPNVAPDNPAVQAINKDYSAMMKKMGLSK
jgi:hypothetical protein